VNFDAQKFFIGLMDFFSILLPGAVLTFFLMDAALPVLLPEAERRALLQDYGVAMFLFASYLSGHLVFLLGAWWLDDVYDWARRHTLNTQVRDLAMRDRFLAWPARALVWLMFRREDDSAVHVAARLKAQALSAMSARGALNTFQWSKAWLAAESPDSLVAVQRFEADSKFFRSFVIVLIVLAAFWAFHCQWLLFATALVLLPLAGWRYAEQRLKSTNQAYWSVITLAARTNKLVVPASQVAEGPGRAGGVVYRGTGEQVRYLLVEATDDPRQWVLPKGHTKPGEHPRETAVREVHEECGVWAGVDRDLGLVTLGTGVDAMRVHFLLMKRRGRGRRQDVRRRHRWLSLEDACQATPFEESRELLRRAHTLRGN
jgi:8-oxo-dGTP pyrophosphatase MutT (NUDIX family)